MVFSKSTSRVQIDAFSLSPSLSVSFCPSYWRFPALSLPLPLAFYFPFSLSLFLSLSLTHTGGFLREHTSRAPSFPFSLSLSQTHTHTHTNTHTHTHTRTFADGSLPEHTQNFAINKKSVYIYSLSLSLSLTHTHTSTQVALSKSTPRIPQYGSGTTCGFENKTRI